MKIHNLKYPLVTWGSRYGRWEVIGKKVAVHNGIRFWQCQCDCGTIKSIREFSLRYEQSQSCGCLRDERTKAALTTHHLSHTKEYHAWAAMKVRARLGRRKLPVETNWVDSFENFLNDVGNAPSDTQILSRIDMKKGFVKGNVFWRSRKEAYTSRKSCRMLTYEGATKPLTQWAEEKGIHRMTLTMRTLTYPRNKERWFAPVRPRKTPTI